MKQSDVEVMLSVSPQIIFLTVLVKMALKEVQQTWQLDVDPKITVEATMIVIVMKYVDCLLLVSKSVSMPVQPKMESVDQMLDVRSPITLLSVLVSKDSQDSLTIELLDVKRSTQFQLDQEEKFALDPISVSFLIKDTSLNKFPRNRDALQTLHVTLEKFVSLVLVSLAVEGTQTVHLIKHASTASVLIPVVSTLPVELMLSVNRLSIDPDVHV